MIAVLSHKRAKNNIGEENAGRSWKSLWAQRAGLFRCKIKEKFWRCTSFNPLLANVKD